jgi:hypothetical protein
MEIASVARAAPIGRHASPIGTGWRAAADGIEITPAHLGPTRLERFEPALNVHCEVTRFE